MADVMLQHVDTLMVERIKTLARERQWSINDVMLRALRLGLGLSTEQGFSETLRDQETLTVLSGHWDAQERGVLQEAMRALAQAPATQFAPEKIRLDASAAGAE